MAESQRKQKRAAGFLILARAPRQFLLMRHADRWDLPKGHCDRGESDLETALRETEEETGIQATQIAVDDAFRFTLRYPVCYKRSGDEVFEKQVTYFLGEIEEPVTPTLTEHQSFQWFDWSPPHAIQTQTIDPLLDAIAKHLDVKLR